MEHSSMSVFHVFWIVHMVLNRATHLIWGLTLIRGDAVIRYNKINESSRQTWDCIALRRTFHGKIFFVSTYAIAHDSSKISKVTRRYNLQNTNKTKKDRFKLNFGWTIFSEHFIANPSLLFFNFYSCYPILSLFMSLCCCHLS